MKKVLSILLAIVMSLSFGITAFADNEPSNNSGYLDNVINFLDQLEEYTNIDIGSYCRFDITGAKRYASLGDSLTFGFGIGELAPDCNNKAYDGKNLFEKSYGYGAADINAFPVLLAEKLGILKNKEYIYPALEKNKEGFEQLAIGSMRAGDILHLLDPNFSLDGYGKRVFSNWENEYNITKDEMIEDYKNAIEKSDVITLTLGGNDISTFLLHNLQCIVGMLDETEPDALNWASIKTVKDGDIEKLILALKNAIYQSNDEDAISLNNLEQTITEIAENIAYAYFRAIEHMAILVNKIHEMNPKAKIAIIGLYNPIDNVSLDLSLPFPIPVEGLNIPGIKVGGIINLMVNAVNMSYKSLAMLNGTYCAYVDVTGAETVLDSSEDKKEKYSLKELSGVFNENHGAAAHESVEGHKFIYNKLCCTLFGGKCITSEKIALNGSGSYGLRLGNQDKGNFYFTKCENGWTIKNKNNDGYLKYDNGKVVITKNENEATQWEYSLYTSTFSYTVKNNIKSLLWRMITRGNTVYYLISDGDGFNVSTNIYLAEAELIGESTDAHDYMDPVPFSDNYHIKYCSKCGTYVYENHEYCEDGKCGCGAWNPDYTEDEGISVKVSITEKDIRITRRLTIKSYTVKIGAETKEKDDRITGISYKQSNSRYYIPGMIFTTTVPSNFDILVSTNDGDSTIFTYEWDKEIVEKKQ